MFYEIDSISKFFQFLFDFGFDRWNIYMMKAWYGTYRKGFSFSMSKCLCDWSDIIYSIFIYSLYPSIRLRKAYCVQKTNKRMESILLNSIKRTFQLEKWFLFWGVNFSRQFSSHSKNRKIGELPQVRPLTLHLFPFVLSKAIHGSCECDPDCAVFNKVCCFIQWTHKFDVIGILFIKSTGVKCAKQRITLERIEQRVKSILNECLSYWIRTRCF